MRRPNVEPKATIHRLPALPASDPFSWTGGDVSRFLNARAGAGIYSEAEAGQLLALARTLAGALLNGLGCTAPEPVPPRPVERPTGAPALRILSLPHPAERKP
jgi:hypothetical protein